MNNKKVQGRTSLYNPLLQKPIALHPVGPGSYPAGYGGYSYIGPPPDFGGTYGKFQDTGGREQIGIKSSKMFSIHDGSPAQLQAELSPEERQALLSQIDEISEQHKCSGCRSELSVSVGKNMDKVFCPHCGSEMDGAAEKVKQCVSKIEEMKSMSTVEAKAKAAKASGPDLAKEAMKKENPADVNKDLKPEAAKMHELKDAQKGIETIKPMEELGKDLVKAEADADAKKKAKRERIRSSIKAYRAKKAAKAQASESAAPVAPAAEAATPAAPAAPVAPVETPQIIAPSAPAVAAAPVAAQTEEQTKLRRELRIMAALDPKKFAEVRKNAKLSAICAEVEKVVVKKADRIKVRAELAVLASEDMEAHKELSKHLDFIAPEILMEENIQPPASEHIKPEGEEGEVELKVEEKSAESEIKPEGEEVKPADGEKGEEGENKELAPPAQAAPKLEQEEKDAKHEEKEIEGCGDAMGMKTEFLASLASLKGDKIEMSLYNEESQNPFWNIVIDGEPVGRVFMADQPSEDPQAIRAAFCNDSYAKNFGAAARSVGLQKLLTITKAHLFAHRADDSEMTARIREKAKVQARAEMEEKLQTLRLDFMKAVSLAMVASDKNFYKEEAGHILKEGLWNSMVQAGLTENGAIWAIEAGFDHAPDYFEFLMAKAQEIMDMPIEARHAIEKQILNAGKMEVNAEQPVEENLSQRLVKSSLNVMAMGGQVSAEDRKELRSQLKLSANRK